MRSIIFSCLLSQAVAFVPTHFWDSMAFKQVGPTEQRLIGDPIFSQIEHNYYEFSASHHSKDGLIPATIHFIWLGSDIPTEAQISIDSWRKYHPGWPIKIWRDADLEGFAWTTERTEKNFYAAGNYAEKADILRYEILYQFGGIYSDTDVICVKPFHDLIRSDLEFFAGIEVNYVSRITKNPLHVGPAILGSVKGEKVMKYCLDHHIGSTESPGGNNMNGTGPGLLSRAIVHCLLEINEKILLLPISYFYPFPFVCRHVSFDKAMTYQAPETMAIHLWNGSWLPKEELERVKQVAISSGYVASD